jgi:hypothetical protein
VRERVRERERKKERSRERERNRESERERNRERESESIQLQFTSAINFTTSTPCKDKTVSSPLSPLLFHQSRPNHGERDQLLP